jgi:hypothetical protein
MRRSFGRYLHSRLAQNLASPLMKPVIDFGATFIADTHSAHWLAGLAGIGVAADRTHLQYGGRYSSSGAYECANAIDGDRKI